MNWIYVLKHRLNIRGLRQSPWSTPRLKGIGEVEKQSEITYEWKSAYK